MQSIPDYWYKRLNLALGVGAFLIIAAYGLLTYVFDIDVEIFGLSFAAAIGAGVTLIYTLLGFRLGKNSNVHLAGFIGFILFAVTIFLATYTTGGYSSPALFAWVVILFVSGAYGMAVIAGTILTTLVYFALTYFGVTGTGGNVDIAVLITAISIAASLVSLEVWRHLYQQGESVNHVKKLSSELHEEKLLSEILVNSIADGMIAINMQGKIEVFNPAAEKITGWSKDEAIGIDYGIIMRLYKIDQEEEVALTKNDHPFVLAIKKGQSVAADTILHTKNDQSLELALTVSPITLDGKVQGLVAIFRDVSEQRKQERQRTEFISTASHEMRTPVAAIEGYLSLAMNDKVTNIDSKARDYLQKAYESTQHLGQLFKDLLAAAKSEDGRISNHPEVLEVNEFLEKVAEDLQFTAEKQGLKLNYTTGNEHGGEQVVAPLFYVYVDPERIREVVTNLVNNAVKFTEKGSITIGLRGDEKVVQMFVKDTGYGIPEEDVPHLFQKFYRVDNSATRTIGGTGLGLFISRNIIELYNGRIWVESKLGEGSTFYINLPRLSTQQVEELKRKQESIVSPITVKQKSI